MAKLDETEKETGEKQTAKREFLEKEFIPGLEKNATILDAAATSDAAEPAREESEKVKDLQKSLNDIEEK